MQNKERKTSWKEITALVFFWAVIFFFINFIYGLLIPGNLVVRDNDVKTSLIDVSIAFIISAIVIYNKRKKLNRTISLSKDLQSFVCLIILIFIFSGFVLDIIRSDLVIEGKITIDLFDLVFDTLFSFILSLIFVYYLRREAKIKRDIEEENA